MSGSGVRVGYMNAQHQRVVACARTRGNPPSASWCGARDAGTITWQTTAR